MSDFTKAMLDRIEAERERQKEMGYRTQDFLNRNGAYGAGELGGAAAQYLLPKKQRDSINNQLNRPGTPPPYHLWPWAISYFKPDTEGNLLGRLRELEKGAALALAEMERIYSLARTEIKEVVPDGGDNFDEWYASFKHHILLEREMGYEVTTMEQLQEYLSPDDDLQMRGNYDDGELPRQAFENCYYEH